MEGEQGAGEFHEWEVLHSSDSPALMGYSVSDVSSKPLDGIEADSGGVIRSDYFSFASEKRVTRTSSDVSEEGSIGSDNPSWIDPGSETRYERSNPGEFWSDSGSDRSESRKLSEFDGKHELGFAESANSQVGSEGIGEIRTEIRDLSKVSQLCDFDGKSGLGFVENVKSQVGLEALDKDSGKVCVDSGEYGSFNMNSNHGSLESETSFDGEIQEGSELLGENSDVSGLVMEFEGGDDHGNRYGEGERSLGLEESKTVVAVSEEHKSNGEERRVVWWKVPFEVVKFCVFRVSPIWSLSAAAAVMGFIVLGRVLYKMKRKSKSLQLKVTVDDKKVSQFMIRAARLNEAFSVVRRAPIVRPSLSAAGVTPWPVLSMR